MPNKLVDIFIRMMFRFIGIIVLHFLQTLANY